MLKHLLYCECFSIISLSQKNHKGLIMFHRKNKLSDTLVHSLNKSLEVAFKDFIGDDNPFNLDMLVHKKNGYAKIIVAPTYRIDKLKDEKDEDPSDVYTCQDHCFSFEVSVSPFNEIEFFIVKNMKTFHYGAYNISFELLGKDHVSMKKLIDQISICMDEAIFYFDFGDKSNAKLSIKQIKSTKNKYRRDLLISIAKRNDNTRRDEEIEKEKEKHKREHYQLCDELDQL